jgi:hypothetical protein
VQAPAGSVTNRLLQPTQRPRAVLLEWGAIHALFVATWAVHCGKISPPSAAGIVPMRVERRA